MAWLKAEQQAFRLRMLQSPVPEQTIRLRRGVPRVALQVKHRQLRPASQIVWPRCMYVPKATGAILGAPAVQMVRVALSAVHLERLQFRTATPVDVLRKTKRTSLLIRTRRVGREDIMSSLCPEVVRQGALLENQRVP